MPVSPWVICCGNERSTTSPDQSVTYSLPPSCTYWRTLRRTFWSRSTASIELIDVAHGKKMMWYWAIIAGLRSSCSAVPIVPGVAEYSYMSISPLADEKLLPTMVPMPILPMMSWTLSLPPRTSAIFGMNLPPAGSCSDGSVVAAGPRSTVPTSMVYSCSRRNCPFWITSQ